MKKFSCDKCNKSYSSPQSLWNHRQKCKSIEKKDMLPTPPEKLCCSSFGKTKDNLKSSTTYKNSQSFVDKIINNNLKEPAKSMKVENMNGDDKVYTPEERKKFLEVVNEVVHIPDANSKSKSPPIYLPSDAKALLDKLCILYGEYMAGNKRSTRPQILAILKALSDCNIISKQVYTDTMNKVNETKSEESSDESETDGSELETSVESADDFETELELNELIKAIIENLTRNERKNISNLLQNFDQDVQKEVEKFLNGEITIDEVIRILKDDNNSFKLKMLLRFIDKTTKRINKTLNSLNNMNQKDKIHTLEQLKLHNLISEDEYHRLLTSADDIVNYTRAIIGNGIWI
jgi:hypothetical protein